MWDDLLRMEGSWSTGWLYHLCILQRRTIRRCIARQRYAIVSQQDKLWKDMMLLTKMFRWCWLWIRLEDSIKQRRSNIIRDVLAVLLPSTAEINTAHTHLEAAQNDLCQHSWVPVLFLLLLLLLLLHLPFHLRCVCPASSSLWSSATERVPATSTSNHILSVSHRQEVLQGKKKVGEALTLLDHIFPSFHPLYNSARTITVDLKHPPCCFSPQTHQVNLRHSSICVGTAQANAAFGGHLST